MAKQVKKSNLMSKLGTKGAQAFAAHKDDETKFGRIELPAGIEAGVAQLVECKFGEYEKGDFKGEPYFMAAGVVIEPKEHNGIPVEGQRTQIGPIPICDTPKRTKQTMEEHIADVLNEFRKLGVSTSEMSEDGSDLEPTAEMLKADRPFFRFRTWKGEKATSGPYKGKEPLTNHEWLGVCQYSPDGEAGDGVEDATGDAGPEAVEEVAEEQDLAALGEAADGGDEEAQAKLQEMAEAANIDPNAISTWAEVAEALSPNNSPEDGAEEAGEDPEVGNVYKYRPKGHKKDIECEVTGVFTAKQTVNLKNLDDGKTAYKNVAWSDLR